MPDLPDEIDATENPLSIESTKLVGAYTADFHHHEHAPKPRVLRRRGRPGTRRSQGMPAPSAVGRSGCHRPAPQRRCGQQRPAPRQRRPSTPAVRSEPGQQSRWRPVPGPPAACPPPPMPHPRTHTRRHRRRRRDKVMKVLLAPDKFKGSLTAAEVVHHLGNGLTERGHPATRAAARRRRRRQRRRPRSQPGSGRIRDHRRRGHRPRTPHHRRVRRHHRRHRGRQHLRPAHPARREAGPAGQPPAGSLGEAIVSLLRRNAQPDRPGPRRIGQHRRRRRACSPRSVRCSGTTPAQALTIDGGTLQRIRSIDLTGLPDLSRHRDRHRQRRAEPADRTRRGRRRLRPAEGRHPDDLVAPSTPG